LRFLRALCGYILPHSSGASLPAWIADLATFTNVKKIRNQQSEIRNHHNEEYLILKKITFAETYD